MKWVIAYAAVSDTENKDTRIYCISEETTSEVNPGNASWGCEYMHGQNEIVP